MDEGVMYCESNGAYMWEMEHLTIGKMESLKCFMYSNGVSSPNAPRITLSAEKQFQ